MKIIQLRHGWSTLVDDEDFDYLNQFQWSMRTYRGKPYVTRSQGVYRKGTYKTIRMHRQIMGVAETSYPFVDHIDGNGLNNLRENLRLCTNAENIANRTKQRNNTSGFKGVFYDQNNTPKPWMAKIGKTGIYGGNFATAEEAARRYDEMARARYGEFANLNFPNEPRT